MIRDVESSIHVSKNWFIGEKFVSEGMRPGETKHGKRGDWEKKKNTPVIKNPRLFISAFDVVSKKITSAYLFQITRE